MACGVEVGAAVFEEVKSLEVVGTLVEAFCMFFMFLVEWCKIIGL